MFNLKQSGLLIVILLALVGSSLVLYSTSWGIGTSPDSVAYIGAARNLAAGLGLTVPFGGLVDAPMIHHAPFYPVFIGTLGLIGIDPAKVARGLAIIIMGLNVLLAAWLVRGMLPGTNWPSVIGALLVAISPTILEIHSMAWTEPMFIFLGFFGLGLLALWLDNQSLIFGITAALLVGLATLTRYAGLAFIATGVLGILLLARERAVKRLAYASSFGLISGLPLSLWGIQNHFAVGTATNRSLNFHPIERSQLWQGMGTVSSWLLVPENASTLFHLASLALLGLVAGAALVIIWRSQNTKLNAPGINFRIFTIFVPVYFLFLVVSISFFDANTPLDGRILSPLFFAGVVGLIAIFGQAAVYNLPRVWQAGLLLYVFVLVIGYGQASLKWVQESHHQGIGFSSTIWQGSPTLATVRNFPKETLIYTNVPEGVYFSGEHRSMRLPVYFEAVRQQVNPNFEVEIGNLKHQLVSGQAVVVYFTQLGRQDNPSETELVDQLSLVLVAAYPDGNIYGPHAEITQITP